LYDPRVRVCAVIPNRPSTGDPADFTHPFIDRDKVDNPFECGFPSLTGDALSY